MGDNVVPSLKEQHAFLDKAKKHDFASVRALVSSQPALVNVQPAGRWSALHHAAEHGHKEMVRFLLALGADCSSQTKDGRTPAQVAKRSSIRALLGEGAGTKRSAERMANVGEKPTKVPRVECIGDLFVFGACSGLELAERVGWDAHDWGMVESMQHRDMEQAPAIAGEVAKAMQNAAPGLEGIQIVRSNEADGGGTVIVIASAGDNPAKACLKALGISKVQEGLEEERQDEKRHDDMAGVSIHEQDWSKHLKSGFNRCAGDEFDSDDDDEGEMDQLLNVTKIMNEKLDKHFEFGFTDECVNAPMIFGGYASDGCIVGVLSSRVWT